MLGGEFRRQVVIPVLGPADVAATALEDREIGPVRKHPALGLLNILRGKRTRIALENSGDICCIIRENGRRHRDAKRSSDNSVSDPVHFTLSYRFQVLRRRLSQASPHSRKRVRAGRSTHSYVPAETPIITTIITSSIGQDIV